MSSQNNSEVIPFGKYCGRPIEELASDPQYMAWLVQQPWFAERHTNLYQIVINNFQEPDETPEHNRLQAKFLDEEWCRKFMTLINVAQFKVAREPDIPLTAEEAIAAPMQSGTWGPRPKSKRGPFKMWTRLPHPTIKFEEYGIDVTLSDKSHWTGQVRVECKPTLGDDYPAVLRKLLAARRSLWEQLKERSRTILLVGSFSSLAITAEQLKTIFNQSDIVVIFIEEIENTEALVSEKIPPRQEKTVYIY